MASRSLRRGILIAAALAVAALVLPPFINISRYKGTIAASMSSALGRPVTVGSVSLRLLPRPGFHLENVVVSDDPAYSSEPILHSDEVSAYIGVSSLWRGKLDIARLSLRFPSLNLVERIDGGWNLESLLWRAAQTQAAPTGAGISESRPRFPYIDATHGRVNFKYGQEKSVFSFTEADFTLYSPGENQWHMRMEARPVRTDMPVTDTGIVKTEVDLQRAPQLRDAPIKATMTWERVQLGNLTRLIEGEDRGWRGTLDASLQLSGTPGALKFASAAQLRDFRHFDILSGDAVNLSATCSGEADVMANLLQQTECHMPLGGGVLSVKGTLSGLHFTHYDLALKAENLPAGALLNLARHAKRNLPPDLAAEGRLDAAFQARRSTDAPPDLVGGMTLQDLALRSSVLGKNLKVSRVVAAIDTTEPTPARERGRRNAAPPEPVRALVIQSFDLPLGEPAPASVQGTIDDQRFSLHLKGEASLDRLQQFARAIGVDAPKIALAGPAALDIAITGGWGDFISPEVTGSAQLKNARAEVPGLLAPLEIASARVDFDRHRLALRNASASVGKVTLTGNAELPRSCDADSPCESSFDLATDELNPERWNEVLNPHIKKRPWYRLFGAPENEHNVIADLHATGHLSARHLTLGPAAATGFETDFAIANGLMELKSYRASLLGGSISGAGKIDFTASEPKYESTGSASGISAEKLTPLLKSSLGTGSLSLNYKLTFSGLDADKLIASTKAEADFSWSGGTLRLSPDGKAPLRVISGQGRAALDEKGWKISDCKWTTPGGIYQLSGTISRNFALALEFTQESGEVWKLAGTLAKPLASAPPQPSQARKR